MKYLILLKTFPNIQFFNMSLSKTVPLKDYNTHFALWRAKHMNTVKNTVGSGIRRVCTISGHRVSICQVKLAKIRLDCCPSLTISFHMDCLGILHSNTARQVSIRFQRKDKMSQTIPVEKQKRRQCMDTVIARHTHSANFTAALGRQLCLYI